VAGSRKAVRRQPANCGSIDWFRKRPVSRRSGVGWIGHRADFQTLTCRRLSQLIVIFAECTMSKHQICVNTVPVDRTNFIKTLRLAGRLELKQALDLTIHLERYGHSILVAGIDLPVAEHLAEALRKSGAEVDVQVSSIQTPMLCVPQVNATYVWRAFRSIRKAS
jgi:hypothetical protein